MVRRRTWLVSMLVLLAGAMLARTAAGGPPAYCNGAHRSGLSDDRLGDLSLGFACRDADRARRGQGDLRWGHGLDLEATQLDLQAGLRGATADPARDGVAAMRPADGAADYNAFAGLRGHSSALPPLRYSLRLSEDAADAARLAGGISLRGPLHIGGTRLAGELEGTLLRQRDGDGGLVEAARGWRAKLEGPAAAGLRWRVTGVTEEVAAQGVAAHWRSGFGIGIRQGFSLWGWQAQAGSGIEGAEAGDDSIEPLAVHADLALVRAAHAVSLRQRLWLDAAEETAHPAGETLLRYRYGFGPYDLALSWSYIDGPAQDDDSAWQVRAALTVPLDPMDALGSLLP